MKITIAFTAKYYWEIVLGYQNEFHSCMCLITLVKWEKLTYNEMNQLRFEDGSYCYPGEEAPVVTVFLGKHPKYYDLQRIKSVLIQVVIAIPAVAAIVYSVFK